MSINVRRAWFCSALALAAAIAGARVAMADTLLIDSSQSAFTITVQLGFDDPDNPGTFLPIATSQGQGGILPTAIFSGPVLPGFSNGDSAQLTGSMDVQVSGGAITVGPLSSINLLPSGLWQPGTNANGTGAPLPAEWGGYILASFAGTNDLTAILTMNGTQFVVSATGALDGLGNFTDPAASVHEHTDLLGRVVDTMVGFDQLINVTNSHGTVLTALSGNYSNGVLTLPVSAAILADESDTLPGLEALFSLSGTVVTLPVPEPSSLALAALGLLGLGFARSCRRRG